MSSVGLHTLSGMMNELADHATSQPAGLGLPPLPQTLSNAVNIDKWHLRCHLPFCHEGGRVLKSHISETHGEQFDLRGLRELHNS